jgi:hypothetical protein
VGSVRRRAFTVTRALVAIAIAGSGALAMRCADVARGLGQACIRDEDCMSGVCAGSICVPAPTTFDSGPPDASSVDAAPEAAPVDAAVDAHHAMEATVVHRDAGHPHDAHVEAADMGEGGHDEASDAASPPDAHPDQHATDAGVPHDSGGMAKDGKADGSDDAHHVG